MEQFVRAARSKIVELGIAEEKIFMSNCRTTVLLHPRQLQIFFFGKQCLEIIKLRYCVSRELKTLFYESVSNAFFFLVGGLALIL